MFAKLQLIYFHDICIDFERQTTMLLSQYYDYITTILFLEYFKYEPMHLRLHAGHIRRYCAAK